MPHTNGLAQHHHNYINKTTSKSPHKTNNAFDPPTSPNKSPEHINTTYDKMSNNDDRTANNGTTGHRCRRVDPIPRGRARGMGFHFSLNAQMALTQHLMRRSQSLRPAATDTISLTIGIFYDALLNAKKLDKNVYPSAADRDDILQTKPNYLYDPSARQEL